MLKIKTFPRIHITLIGMDRRGYRMNGGIGFSLKDPSIDLQFQSSSNFLVTDSRNKGLNEVEQNKLLNRLESVFTELKLSKKISCVIQSSSITHYGFGTSTSIRMACIEALFLINGIDYTPNLVQKYSGRGGTSGIGINTYFNGGFVFDLGIKNSLAQHLPSSAQENKSNSPLVLLSHELPNWEIGLAIPSNISPKTQAEEIDFFNKTCPITKKQTNDIVYEATYGVTASFLENDQEIFSESINRIQETAWKKAERSLYKSELLFLEKILYKNGALCVGMSSLGPSLYFIASDYKKIKDYFINNKIDCEILISSFNNSGRLISNG